MQRWLQPHPDGGVAAGRAFRRLRSFAARARRRTAYDRCARPRERHARRRGPGGARARARRVRLHRRAWRVFVGAAGGARRAVRARCATPRAGRHPVRELQRAAGLSHTPGRVGRAPPPRRSHRRPRTPDSMPRDSSRASSPTAARRRTNPTRRCAPNSVRSRSTATASSPTTTLPCRTTRSSSTRSSQHAARHGLRYLAEADVQTMGVTGISDEAKAYLSTLDPLAREQYLDFLRLRRFRQSLLVRRRCADRHDGALAAPARHACVGEHGADGRGGHRRGPQARAQARSCGGRRRSGAQAARRARRQPAGDV